MLVLDNSVPGITLQFRLNKFGLVPEYGVRFAGNRTPLDVPSRSPDKGTLVIDSHADCGIDDLVSELGDAGYRVVDGLYRAFLNSDGYADCFKVGFLFVRDDCPGYKAVSHEKSRELTDALRTLCENAMWKVRVFSNPFYRDGERVPDQRSVSIDISTRQPYFRSDGEDVTRWEKDENGNKVGDAPLLIVPDCFLVVEDSTLKMVEE